MATDPALPLSRWRSRAEARLDRIRSSPLGRRLDPYLGFSELRRFNPLLALLPMGLLLVFGLVRSQFGHMDTVPAIFPIMALISGLNPFVGILCGLAYGAGDLVQKFVVDDVFYEGIRTAGDYWGARAGYLIAYSALILFGILPGVFSRVGRRVAVRIVGDQRGGVGLPPAGPVAAGAHVVAAIVGAVVGGVAGSLAAAFAWKGAVAPAFLLRPSADHSCYALSGTNVIEAIPTASTGGGIGGGVSTAAPAIPGLGVVGAPMPPPGVSPPPLDVSIAVAGQLAPPMPPGPATPPSPPAPPSSGSAPAPPGPTQGVVVTGQEAIDELINAGFPTVTVDKKTYVKPPTSVGGPITAIGQGKPITLPTGEQVLNPKDLAIVKNVPALSGPTTTATGKDAIDALVNEGFPTYTDPATKKIYVRHPPSLIHGNVGGIAFQGTTQVNGIDVIDPDKGVVVTRVGPPTPPTTTTTTTTPPVAPPVAKTTPVAPPVGPPVKQPPVVGPPVVTPPAPPVIPPVVQVQPPAPPPPKPPPPPTGPPRTPTDAKTLVDSLTKPGTTVITPDNLAGFAPDILRKDGTIIANKPKTPDPLKKLDGLQTPKPVIGDGKVSLDLPLRLGGAEVTMSVQNGRIQADTRTHGAIAAIEGASELDFTGSTTPINVAKSVQTRLDRYNDAINQAGLEVKQVIAEGGQVRVITGPRS
jgi:hypothetical protein